jgi:predicted alpha/beta superfamily hydrolase
MLVRFLFKKHLWRINLVAAFALFCCCDLCAQAGDSIPAHQTHKLTATQLGETRTINIWTPPNYAGSTDSFVVLYMPDGGVNEDFPHIANTLSELIIAGKIQPVILVGIENTERRRDLTGFTQVASDKKIAKVVGGSKAFRSFIVEDLIPFINRNFRVKAQRGLLGESLAGLFVIETFLQTPQLFDYYIAFDPSLWWNDAGLVHDAQNLLANRSNIQQQKLWIASSKAKDIAKPTKKFSNILKQSQVPNLDWSYNFEPKEEHHTIFRATKEKAIIWTLGINN